MKSNSNTFDLKTNIVSTVILTLLAILVAVIASTIIANGMKSAVGANQGYQHQTPAMTPVAATSSESGKAEAVSCTVPDSEGAVTHGGGVTGMPAAFSKSFSSKNTTNITKTSTTTNKESIQNGNVSNSGQDNDLVDIDDFADVNAPVDAHVLNGSLNDSQVLSDLLDVNNNDTSLKIFSSIL